MPSFPSEVEVAVVGAGAAGLAAARTLREAGVGFALLEASHRIGGRAYTEEVAPGTPFDLGCHWLHSASRNPFVAIADELGIAYTKEGFSRGLCRDGAWASDAEVQRGMDFFDDCFKAIHEAAQQGREASLADVTERESEWTPLFDYLISLWSSLDSDQVSVMDFDNYVDTEENWPVKDGYGTLIARWAGDTQVALNSAVREIDWSGRKLRLTTPRGELRAERVIITVSTGILGGGDIRFTPALPDWKQAAIAALPLGNHNRICLIFERNVFGPEHARGALVTSGDSEPMHLRIRPFGFDYVVGMTGGRFADWLERAGTEASADLAKEYLASAFGSDIAKQVARSNVTAWRGDPWVRGAYAAASPGQAHQRAALARPIDERLFFAGEATSPDFFSTAHGAYLTGIATAKTIAALNARRNSAR